MIVPKKIHSKVQELMKEYNYTKEWEIVSKALQYLEHTDIKKHSTFILRNHSTNQVLIDILKDLISNSRELIFIATLTIDNTFQNEITNAIKWNVDVRVIIGAHDRKDLTSHNRKRQIQTDLMQKKLIKFKEDYHGRMIIIDNTLFVGADDHDSQGMMVHDNILIQTTDDTLVESAKEIFSDLEKCSIELEYKTNNSVH